ncbi:MAG TPA: hypothetical protein VIK08_00160 [Candidatus Limnocylindrales bacterium]
MAMLARYAKPILLLDTSLLLAGVLLTSSNLLLLGWSVYAAGHVLAILAFLALGALYRGRLDGWSWAGLLVLELGLILALPQVANIWSSYAVTPTQAQMLVPAQTYPIGLAAEGITWLGLAFFGLGARGARVLPAGVGWLFAVASVLGLLADFVHVWPLSPLWWVVAMLVMITGLVAIGAGLSPAQPAAEPLAPEPA